MSPATARLDVAAVLGALYGDGFLARRGALERAFVADLARDLEVLDREALSRPGGALPRGPNRHYVEIHPERLRGFVRLLTHPWITGVCAAVLGPEWKLVEVGYDVPGPGAKRQPWHRDFPAPAATKVGRRLDSLAFNLTTVDVDDAMGPFEIAPGTQWDDDAGWKDGMFPPAELWARYEERAQRKLPSMGDVSTRSALTIHRGTENRSPRARPVLVLGVDAPGARNAERHDVQFTRAFHAGLPGEVRAHVTCRVVDALEPIVQAHAIEGLLAADDGYGAR
jgi:hypothetical protein